MAMNVQALQQTTESLFRLLGGTADERMRFWEILKGVTTPAVSRVMQHQIAGIDAHLKVTQEQLKGLQQSTRDVGE